MNFSYLFILRSIYCIEIFWNILYKYTKELTNFEMNVMYHFLPRAGHTSSNEVVFKGIVSQEFEGLQMILIIRLCVPHVPLEVYSFLHFRFHMVL